MTLQERLMQDFKEAMKSKDEVKKNTLSFARAGIKQVEVDTRKELKEEEIIDILAKQVKMRRDAIVEFKKAGRDDLIAEYEAEIQVLIAYLPKQLSLEELQEIIKETARDLEIESGNSNMGKLIGGVMPKVKGVADGNLVRNLVMEFLK